jgi:hypothetical protein
MDSETLGKSNCNARVQTQLNPISDEGRDLDGGEEVASELVISGGDTPEIFKPAEAALDDVASLVGAFVEAMEGYSVGLVRYDRFCAAINDVGAEVIAVITLVGDEGTHGRGERQQGRCGDNVCVLAGSEMKCAGPTVRIAQCVDFRGASAA